MSERVVDHLLTMLWRGAIDKLAAAVSTNFLLHSFLSPNPAATNKPSFACDFCDFACSSLMSRA